MFVCALWLRNYTFNCMCLHSISHPSVQTADSQPVCQQLPAVSCSLSLEIVVGGIPSWSSPAAGGSYVLLFPPYLLLSSGAWRKPYPHPRLSSPEGAPSATKSRKMQVMLLLLSSLLLLLCVIVSCVYSDMYRCRSLFSSGTFPQSL